MNRSVSPATRVIRSHASPRSHVTRSTAAPMPTHHLRSSARPRVISPRGIASPGSLAPRARRGPASHRLSPATSAWPCPMPPDPAVDPMGWAADLQPTNEHVIVLVTATRPFTEADNMPVTRGSGGSTPICNNSSPSHVRILIYLHPPLLCCLYDDCCGIEFFGLLQISREL